MLTTLQLKDREIRDWKIKAQNYQKKCQHLTEYYEELLTESNKKLRQKDEVIAQLQNIIAKMGAQNTELQKLYREHLEQSKAEKEKYEDTIAVLKASLSLDSSNSGKPPSTNGFKHVVQNNREPGNRKPGGQVGHKGSGLDISAKLKEQIDSGKVSVKVVEHGTPGPEYVSKYELDIQMEVIVTEHRFYKGEPIPAQLQNRANYGTGVKAICAYLSTEGLMSAERIATFICDLTDGCIKPSKSTVLAIQRELSEKLDGEMEELRQSVLRGEVLCVDETGIKATERPVKTQTEDDGEPIPAAKDGDEPKNPQKVVNGVLMETKLKGTFNVCARSYCTKDTNYITLNPRKDKAGVDNDGILPVYDGFLIHDHDLKYYRYGQLTKHGECDSHATRYLKGDYELTRNEWSLQLRCLLFGMLAHKEKDLENGIDKMDWQSWQYYNKEYDKILELGKKEIARMNSKSSITKDSKNLWTRLEKFKYNHLLFAMDYTVPFTNNDAERSHRWLKVQQKISGCFRSYEGAKIMVRLVSWTRTLKKRNLSLFKGIKDIFNGEPVLATRSP